MADITGRKGYAVNSSLALALLAFSTAQAPAGPSVPAAGEPSAAEAVPDTAGPDSVPTDGLTTPDGFALPPPPTGSAIPIVQNNSQFGFQGPIPFAPNPWLAYGYSRPGEMFEAARELLQSDRSFDGFVGPISNPILAKDPRASTFFRMLFVTNNMPGQYPYQGGNLQFWIPQVGVAVTERFSVSIDQMGCLTYSPRTELPYRAGALDTTLGAKYTFYRDPEAQQIAAAGLMYQIPSGSSEVWQGQGGGLFTPYLTGGTEFWHSWHLLGTFGWQIPANPHRNNSLLYQSIHIDREVCGWFYPLVEFNWFQYVGNPDLVPVDFREGDGLLNLGTRDVTWTQFLSLAVGAKAKIGEWTQIGAAYEFPLSTRKNIMNNRVTVELLLRY